LHIRRTSVAGGGESTPEELKLESWFDDGGDGKWNRVTVIKRRKNTDGEYYQHSEEIIKFDDNGRPVEVENIIKDSLENFESGTMQKYVYNKDGTYKVTTYEYRHPSDNRGDNFKDLSGITIYDVPSNPQSVKEYDGEGPAVKSPTKSNWEK